MTSQIKRGEIYYADLSPVVGSEQGGIRPVLIIQNDVGNKYSPTVIVSAITSQLGKAKLPTHIDLFEPPENLEIGGNILSRSVPVVFIPPSLNEFSINF